MAKLTIPKSQKSGLKFLIELDEQLQTELFDAIGKVELNFSTDELVEKLFREKGIEKGKVSKIIDALFSILGVITFSRMDATTFLKEFTIALEELELKLNDNLRSQLVKFLECEDSSFHLKFKSLFLSRERENIFRESNVYTDMRPIFDNDGTQVLGTMILHNLKISYFDGKHDFATSEIYLALDNEDLTKLKETIIRAEKKETIIRKKLKSIDLSILDY